MGLKEKIFINSPLFIQELMVTLYNVREYRKRYGGNYKKYLAEYQNRENLSLEELEKIQKEKLSSFLSYVTKNSKFYQKYEGAELSSFPIINKETLRANIADVITVSKNEAIVSKTGGTTGKSLQVHFTHDDMQMRYATLDSFRSQYGYKLGERTAWFSGKKLLTSRDLKVNRYWKTDHLYKVRYYSTFHIKEEYLKYYLENLIKFKPLYFVGFPSSMLEIAKYGLRNNIDFPKGIKAIFPTAETVTAETRRILSEFFKTDVYDQYASSEGAPFIIECKNHKLHADITSGVFEVLDENNKPSKKGRLVLTSFTTHGTPLVRYDIGDQLEWDTEKCDCGNNNPIVKSIDGRIDDYIYSPETGKINLGNISNTLKDTKGIKKFQVVQDKLDEIEIFIVIDEKIYSNKIEEIFIQNWVDRVGNSMNMNLHKVEDIPTEKSGKYRIVKNNIKNLLN